MALRAKYEADFNDFYAATAQATTSLDTMEKAGADVEKQMDDVAHSLTGGPLNADLSAATASVETFGVQTVEAGKHIENVANESAGLSGTFREIGAAMAAAFTVQQLGAFVVGVMDAAAEIGDLSIKLGISTEAAQRFKFAAEQSGTTIDNVGRSIQSMNNKLAVGDKSTVAALNQLGLDLETLRASGPEQAFVAIGDAVGDIQDPMEQTRLAIEFFGKSGVENLQLFKAGIADVGAQTAVMSEETIKRLKDAQDAWGRLSNSVTIYSGELIGATFKIGESWQNLGIALATAAIPFPGLRDNVGKVVDAMKDFDLVSGSAAQAASDLGAMVATVPEPTMAVGRALEPVAIEGRRVDLAIRAMNESLHLTTEQMGLVEPKLGTLAQFTRNMAKETESLDAVTRSASQGVEVFNSGLVFTSEVIGELPDKVSAAASAIENLTSGIASASSGPQMGTSKPGGTINTAGISVGGPGLSMESVFDQYTKRYGGGSSLGMIGGGPPPDFLSWALSMGLAQKNAPSFPAGGAAGAPVNQTINMNGLLGTDDPATRDMIKTMVGDAMAESLRGQRLLSSA